MSKDMDDGLVRRLAGLLDETGLGEIEYETKEWRIRVVKPGSLPVAAAAVPAVAAAAAPGPSAAAATPEQEGEAVPSPMVGTAYLAAEPGSAPFVQAGAKVAKGDTLLIIEAMKVMNPIAAPRAGTVKDVLVENGQPVEYGQTLILLD